MPTQAGVETVGGHHPVATQTFACSSRAGVRSSRSAHTLEKKQLCQKTQKRLVTFGYAVCGWLFTLRSPETTRLR